MGAAVERVYVIGVGMTVFGRFLDRSIKDLSRSAVLEALADAGCGVQDVGAAFFANSGQGYHEGQITIRGQVALRPRNQESIVNVENACQRQHRLPWR
jgi:acetyl-CoA acetyltransferase